MTEEARLILEKLSRIDVRLDEIDAKLDMVEKKLGKVGCGLDKVENRSGDARKMETRPWPALENDIHQKIRLIAEGHPDLALQLDDALQIEREKGLLLVRLDCMEAEIRRMKKQIEEIAQKTR